MNRCLECGSVLEEEAGGGRARQCLWSSVRLAAGCVEAVWRLCGYGSEQVLCPMRLSRVCPQRCESWECGSPAECGGGGGRRAVGPVRGLVGTTPDPVPTL